MKNNFKKIISILSSEERFKIYFISFLSIIRTFLEIIGIGLLIPILTFITNIDQKNNVYIYFDFLKDYDEKEILLFFIITFILIYLIKTIFIIYYNFFNARFSHRLYVKLSEKILKKYLEKNYLFFIQNNSASLIRNISAETNLFALGVVGSLIVIFSNFLLSAGICIVLIYYNFYSLYVIIILSLITFIIVRLNNKKFKSWGEIRQLEAGNILKKLNEIIGSIKEIILYEKRNFFIKQIKKHLSRFADAAIYKDSFLTITSPIIEFLGIFTFFSFLLFLLLFTNTQFSEIVVIFGIFAFASLRLLPNLIQIVRAVQTLKFNLPAINTIFDELKNISSDQDKTAKESINEIKNIEIKNVSFSYPKIKNKTLNDVSLSLNAGDKIGIIGETGSGKTTLINLISGLLKPTNGEILINSKNILNIRNFNDRIGYVSQSVYLSDDTILYNISLKDDLKDKESKKIESIIESLNLQSLGKPANIIIGERGSKLSGGQIQRIGIARALFRNPSILILDEATNALDEKNEKNIFDFICKNYNEKIIVFCTHKKKLLDYCNKIIELKDGKINIKEKT